MKTIKQAAAVLGIIILFFSCQKEFSFEAVSNFAVVTMADTTGKCNIEVKGKGRYVKDSTLDGSVNYVEVTVQVLQPGLYNISTNQNNGFYFADSGFLVNTIPTTLKLRAVGTPVASVLSHFDLTFNGITGCSFEVQVTDSVVYYAEYTLKDTSSNNCMIDTLEGVYEGGTPLNSTNLLTVGVNVSFPGLYTISAGPTNGMTFTASGNFLTTGLHTVTLTGTGTPVAAETPTSGPTVMILKGDNDLAPACSFVVHVDSVDYFPTTVNRTWTYSQDVTPDTTLVKATNIITGIITPPDTVRYFTFASVNAISGKDTFYYRKAAHVYYEYGNTGAPAPLKIYDTIIGEMDFPFLKDNVSVGNTWTSDTLSARRAGVMGTSRIGFKFTAKNLTISLPTMPITTVDTVIQITRDYQFKPWGSSTYISVGSGEFYYARNDGFMKAELNIPTFPTITVYASRF